jgi:superfamily II DNA or RNA helicase
MNNSGFKEVYQQLITSQSIKAFIEQGWLAPYSYYSVRENSVERERITSINEFDIEGDYKTSALEREMDTMQIRARLLDSYQRLASGKKGIIYSISRKHSEHICEEYRKAGLNIVKIDSLTPKNERQLYVQRFKNGQIDIIVNVDIFSEGFDCPDIEFIQLARPTKSLVKYLQQVGRGLRPTQGKTNCLILDNVGSNLQFGLPDDERSWEVHFEGEELVSKTPRGATRTKDDVVHHGPSLEEGDDELVLVANVISSNTPELCVKEQDTWSSEDDGLLKILLCDRGCSMELISMVLKRTAEDIDNRINYLRLNENCS